MARGCSLFTNPPETSGKKRLHQSALLDLKTRGVGLEKVEEDDLSANDRCQGEINAF